LAGIGIFICPCEVTLFDRDQALFKTRMPQLCKIQGNSDRIERGCLIVNDVSCLSVVDGVARAYVTGTARYTVEISFAEGVEVPQTWIEVEADCNCPDGSSVCKHIAAVWLQLEKSDGVVARLSRAQPPAKRQKTSQGGTIGSSSSSSTSAAPKVTSTAPATSEVNRLQKLFGQDSRKHDCLARISAALTADEQLQTSLSTIFPANAEKHCVRCGEAYDEAGNKKGSCRMYHPIWRCERVGKDRNGAEYECHMCGRTFSISGYHCYDMIGPASVRADEEEICFRDQLKHTTDAEKVEQEGWDEENC